VWERVLEVIERCKRRIYPNLPGEMPTWEEWFQLTHDLIRWRDLYAQYIEVTPLVELREMILPVFRNPTGRSRPWVPDQREARVFGAADATLNRLKERLLRTRPGKRGRRPKYDPKTDERVADAWQSGSYRNAEELGRELCLSADQVRRALDRHRKRHAKARDKRARQGP